MEPARDATDRGGGGEPAPKPMFTESQIRKLRFAVIAMGVVLLLGFGLVIARIVFLFSRPPAGPAATAAAAVAAPLPAEMRLDLPAGAVVRNVSLAGNRLAVQFESPSGAGIAIVDLASGRAVQRIELAPATR